MNCPHCDFLLADGVSPCPQCGMVIPATGAQPELAAPSNLHPSRGARRGALIGFGAACACIIATAALVKIAGGHLPFVGRHSLAAGSGPDAEMIAQNNALSPVDFARSAFISLSHGDPGADVGIDFETLNAGGENIGAVYTMMTSEAQKADFRKGFVANYAKSFRQTGASIESLTNWRIESEDSNQVNIAADIPGGHTALVTVSKRGGNQRLSGFNMR